MFRDLPRNRRARGRRLDGWKAVGAYLGRTVRTVQRWEREQGLPLHRLHHHSLASVWADTSELDQWRGAREHAEGARAIPARVRPVLEPALEHCVRAQHFMSKRTRHGFVAAISAYQRALDEDPVWAVPYLGMAEAYVNLSGNELWSPMDGYPKARAAATAALARQPDLAPAWSVIGFVSAFFDGDAVASDEAFDRALTLDPACVTARYWRGLSLMNRGRFGAAMAELQCAVKLSPLSAVIAVNLGRPLLCAQRFDEARDWFERAIEIDPHLWVGYLMLGWCDEGRGRVHDAIRNMSTMYRLSGRILSARAMLAHAHAFAGQRVKAARLLDSVLRESRRTYVSPVRIARVLVALGDYAEATKWLERGRDDRSMWNNTYVEYDYAFAPVLRDPHVRQLLTR